MKKAIAVMLLAAVLLPNGTLSAAAAEMTAQAPSGLCVTKNGTLLVTDTYHQMLWEKQESGALQHLAGGKSVRGRNGQMVGGYQDGAAAQAMFAEPWAIAPYQSGYAVSDTANHAVRYWNGETVRTAAGKEARLGRPTGLAAGSNGSLYIADTENHIIRLLDEKGRITTVAGGTEGCADGAALSAQFREPTGLFFVDDVLYIADSGNHRICKLENGFVTTIAGSAEGEEGNRNGAAGTARFSNPQGVLMDGEALYVADTGNGSVRQVRHGIVTTLCAAGSLGEGLYPVAPRGLARLEDTLYVGDVFARTVFSVSVQATPVFKDVSSQAWYADAVRDAAAYGLMHGVSAEQFEPEAEMERAMFVTMLSRLAVMLEPDTVIDGGNAFADVDVAAYYARAVAWAVENEIVRGENGLFNPNRPITRAEMITMLYRCAQLFGVLEQEQTPQLNFSDADMVEPWARPAFAWAAEQEIVLGDRKRLLPLKNATRAEACETGLRFFMCMGGTKS